jgi:oxygen-independent coproporphyrinogen-3 oxidase
MLKDNSIIDVKSLPDKIEQLLLKEIIASGIELKPNDFDFIFGYPSLNRLISFKQEDSLKFLVTDDSIGLYIHIPFCSQICTFCYFTKTADSDEYVHTQYLNALICEINAYANINPNKELSFCYLGGGTPTLLSSGQLALLISTIYKSFKIGDDFEFTCEASPETLSEEKISVLKKSGITRLSIGVQSFDGNINKLTNRPHNIKDAIYSIHLAERYFTNNFNIDMIYGFPESNLDILLKDLDSLSNFNIPSITYYQIWLRVKTILTQNYHDYNYNIDSLFNQKIIINDFLKYFGYFKDKSDWYIKSTTARFRFQDHKWKNKYFWGIGLSSYAYSNGVYYRNTTSMAKYFEKIKNGKISIDFYKRLSRTEQVMRSIVLGIKLGKGFGEDLLSCFEDNLINEQITKKIMKLVELKLVQIDRKMISLTERGLLMPDNISLFLMSEEERNMYKRTRQF